VGNPCHGLSSTKPSWRHSSPPSNWQIRHRNHMVVMWSRSVTHTRHLPDSGSLCHVLCSTKLSWALTTLPANSRIHLRNCRGLQVLVVLWAGHRKCGGFCSTTPAWRHPSHHIHPPRNCTDRLVLLGRVELWGQRGAAVSPAGWPAVWPEAWAEAWAEAWGMVWAAERSVLALAAPLWGSLCLLWSSRNSAVPATT